MFTDALWLLLPVTLFAGWLLGVRHRRVASSDDKSDSSNPSVKHRLQLLFDSYEDDALDRFIQALEVTPETLSLHLSIGKHFRTEGEVEKAILIHQNLMSHPEIPKVQSEPVIFELAKDYKVAGLFDRAESLLKQLQNSKAFGQKSKKLLLDIYELERDWDNALEVGETIDLKKHSNQRSRISHYWCELAEIKFRQHDLLDAKRQFDKALQVDKSCVRARIGLAKLYIKQERYREAISQIKLLLDSAPEFFDVANPVLRECTEHTQSQERYLHYLQQLYRETGQVNILLSLVDSYIQQGNASEARETLEREIEREPSLPLIKAMLSSRKASPDSNEDTLWQALNHVVQKLGQEKPAFCCESCGFAGKQLHWMCPSCKSWQTVKPYVEYNTGKEIAQHER